jgi:type IV pilus assembly protein PilV
MEKTIGNANGFTLLEVLIATFVLGFGLLGLASMQAQAIRSTGQGGYMSIANNMVWNAAERIHRNAANVGAYNGMNTSTGAKVNCPNITPAPVCSQDFTDWQKAITSLPNGLLQISSVVGTTFDTVTVTVTWRDAVGSHTASLPIQVAP